MFIEKLRLKNFGSLSDFTADFSKINLIVGNNGSGKSKILNTIVYSLCDYLDEKISDYIKIGSDKFEIDIAFNHLSQKYQLQIEGNKKGSEKILTVAGKDVYKNSQAVDYIETYIHNPKLTLASAITMQGKGSDILFEPNQKRIERLKQIFSIDKINNVGLHLKEKIEELKQRVREIEIENDTFRNSKYDDRVLDKNFSEEDIQSLKKQIFSMEKERDSVEQQKALYENFLVELEKYKKAQKDLSDTQDSISLKEKTISEKRRELHTIPAFDSIELLEKERDALLETTVRIKEEIYILDSYLQKQNKINLLEEKKKTFVLKRLPRKPVELPSEIIQDIENLSNEIFALKSKRELVLLGKCPTCGQDYKEFSNIEEFNQSLNDLTLKHDELVKQVSSYNDALKSYEDTTSYNDKQEIQKQAIDSQIEELKKEIGVNPPTTNLETLKENLRESQDKEKVLKEKIEEVKARSKRVTQLNNDIVLEEQNIQSLKNLMVVFQNITRPIVQEKPKDFDENEFNALQKKLEGQEKNKLEYESAVEYNNMIKALRESNKEKERNNCKILDELRNTIAIKDKTKKIIEKDFSSWLISNGTVFIKEKMNQFFQKSYGKFIIDLKTDEKSIDFYYSEDGQNFLNVAMASGYEKEILAISFRMALCSMQNLGFMILDEVDSFSKESNSLRLYESVLQEDFNQIFAITHYENTKDFLMSKYSCNVIEL
jgi:DNA repair exonuclease SbcCD ATPase subunit